MTFDVLVEASKTFFPDLQIKYKDQSWLMKLIGLVLFFNKDFMNTYSTTIGSSIYFPSREFVEKNQRSVQITLMHELVHMHDAKKISPFIFNWLYLLPISLIPFALLLILLSWKVALIASILCLLPFPAYFRMLFEKRAYMVSMYVGYKLNLSANQETDFDFLAKHYLKFFKGSPYYFMWMFKDLDKDFEEAAKKIEAGQLPYDDNAVFKMIDSLI